MTTTAWLIAGVLVLVGSLAAVIFWPAAKTRDPDPVPKRRPRLKLFDPEDRVA